MRTFSAALLTFAISATADAGTLYTSVTLDFQTGPGQAWVSSVSHVDYVKDFLELTTANVGGTHSITNTNAVEIGSSTDGSWTSFLSTYALFGECGYRGVIDGWESKNGTTQGATTGSQCCPMPPCQLIASSAYGGHTVPAVQSVDCGDEVSVTAYPDNGYEFDYWGGSISETANPVTLQVTQNPQSIVAYFRGTACDPFDPTCGCDPIDPTCCDPVSDPTCACDPAYDPSCGCDPDLDPSCGCDPDLDPSCGGGDCDPFSDPFCYCDGLGCHDNNDPIIINLHRGPWQLTGAKNSVLFDIHAVGRKQKIGWTAPGSTLAFLALDRNGDGIINDGSELFGNATPLPNGQKAANGFVALAQYDANGDGVIDSKDPVWQSLLLWVDGNHDGVCQPNELMPISRSQITSISLLRHWTGRRDTSGNVFRYKGLIHFGKRVQAFFDIFLVPVQ